MEWAQKACSWSSESMDVIYANTHKTHDSWAPFEADCGGVSINGAAPACCEVHMQPWGHKKIHNH
jgi:hypothetical protein